MKTAPRITLALSALALFAALPAAAQDATVSLSVTSPRSLTRARTMGFNADTPFLSDAMRAANGSWFEQQLVASGAKVVRWGGIHWNALEERAWDANYWAGHNSMNDAGAFSFDEFLALCKKYTITPIIICPFEPAPEDGSGSVTRQDLIDATQGMAQYVNSFGLTTPVYFEVGNEPYFYFTPAYYLSYLDDYYNVIKAVNPAFKVAVPMYNGKEDFYSGTWRDNLIAAGTAFTGYCDAIDWHSYPILTNGWTEYYNKTDDTPKIRGQNISGKTHIVGEANVIYGGWDSPTAFTPTLGNGIVQTNTFLDAIASNSIDLITAWPSIFGNVDAANSTNGIFNYAEWHQNLNAVRNMGAFAYYDMINYNVRERYLLNSTTSDVKIRQYAFANTTNTAVTVFLINKYAAARSVQINLPSTFSHVNGFVFQGSSLTDMAPTYGALIPARTAVGSNSFTTSLPRESVVVLQFYTEGANAPAAFSATYPAADDVNVSTIPAFTWNPSTNASTYQLVVSTSPTLASPIISEDVGLQTRWTSSTALAPATRYYWRVQAINGVATVDGGAIRTFVTANPLTGTAVDTASTFNGSFETNPINANGWEVSTVSGTPAVTWATDFRTGARSVNIFADQAAPALVDFGKLSASKRLPVSPGSTYRLQAWFKGSGLWLPSATDQSFDQAVSLGARFYDAAGQPVTDWIFGYTYWGSTAWEQRITHATAPASAHTMAIRVRFNGVGTMTVDDLSVTDFSGELVRNHNLEGVAGLWTHFGTAIVTGNQRSGTKSLRVGPNAYAEQPLANLKPGTTYTLVFNGKRANATDQVYVGVTLKDSAGTQVLTTSDFVTTTAYGRKAVTFTTPATTNGDSSRVWVWSSASNTGTGYVDDIAIVPVP